MITINLLPIVGVFAENKDSARDLRVEQIIPALHKGETVTLDFAGITGTTQSFIHALISELFRMYGTEALDKLRFKNCDETVQKVIMIVSEYMQESI